jgi:branched-chain amino acid transport system substrate-binding protein
MRPPDSSNKLWRRRDVIKLLGATAITGPAILRGTTASAATSKVIKIGHVSPQTGPLAPFAEADPFILDQIRTVLAKGITNGGVTYEVQIISKDSQSNTNRASEVAADLILKDKVDLLVASSTPETTNPVALRITLPGSPTSLVDTAHRTKVSLGHTISFGAWKT